MAVGGYIAGQVVPALGLMALPLISIGLAVLGLLLLWASMRTTVRLGSVAA
jgi:predicted MFS family arabinose efflux permease